MPDEPGLYPGAVKATRRLDEWLKRLPAWRLALTVGTFYFVFMVVAGGAIDWAMKGRVNVASILLRASVYTVLVTAASTFGREWRQRQKRQTATSEAAGRSGRDPGHIQRTSLHDLFGTDGNSRD